MAEQKLLNVKEVAKRLRLSQRTIMRYIYAKKLKAIKMGQWRITQEDLDQFLVSHTNQ